ncbi:hypothetical protein C0389_00620 [bacterium]|nr:hypothetical protein [bacterium]
MNSLEVYKEQFLTFNNPLFFAFILSVIIILLIVVIYIKIVYPLQQKFVAENQRYLLEKAELMALFAELDPDPLLRINEKGELLQSNEAARGLFSKSKLENLNISEFLPGDFQNINLLPETWTQQIQDRYFNIYLRKVEKLGITNIYLHDITARKQHENQLELYKSNLRTLTNLLDRQSEELKKTLASELHDDLGQCMIVLRLKLMQLDKYKIEDIQSDLDYISKRMREISHQLAPLNVKNLGLVYTLQKIVNDISEASKIDGKLETINHEDDFEINLTESVKHIVLNCVQEGLSNIVKHSKAKAFLVTLSFDDTLIDLKIADNGVGISVDYENRVLSDDSGIGLFRMRERVRNFGGEFEILSNKKYPTMLNIKLPIGQ